MATLGTHDSAVSLFQNLLPISKSLIKWKISKASKSQQISFALQQSTIFKDTFKNNLSDVTTDNF